MESDSSSMSDDDKLKEAVSCELIACMQGTAPTDKSNKVKPSARKECQEITAKTNKFELKTTKEFRKHVSEKLEEYIERIIEMDLVESSNVSLATSTFNSGVKLLSTSTNFLPNCDDQDATEHQTPAKSNDATSATPRLSDDSDTSEEDEMDDGMLQGVVVSGHDVLSNGEGAFHLPVHW